MQHTAPFMAILAAGALALGGCGGRTHKDYASVAPQYHAAASPALMADGAPEHDQERYDHIRENDFVAVAAQPRSTFSIDVDTASYSNVRRILREGRLPPADAVRIEELVNYFDYQYPGPEGDEPYRITTEVAAAPWNPSHKLVHIGLQARRIEAGDLPPRNLVFLLDVSGSMSSPDKLPLVQKAMKLLVEQLREQDTVAIAVYAGAAGTVLPPTSGAEAGRILEAVEALRPGGSTAGARGIHLAYALAQQSLRPGAINRVILATDGDFNVGASSDGELVRLIEEKRKSGVYLSVLGFGTGNLNDSMMEKLSGAGNGNYAYIDSLAEARKVLVREAGATLVTVAKDVKIQVEFNPARVASYRLIGYENRLLDDQDFADDSKDAGEMGAGHSVTALYEVVPAGSAGEGEAGALRYQGDRPATTAAASGELMWLKVRHKAPEADDSVEASVPVADADGPAAQASTSFRFAAAVAGFGMLLRGSQHAGSLTIAQVEAMAAEALGDDSHGYRAELLELVRLAARHLGDTKNVAVD
jgi:Ca-activated chloride channel homolog